MNEPKTFRAGDTVEWSETHADYPADEGWALTYYLRGPSTLDISAAADGAAFDVTISATDSANLSAGIYSLQGRFSKGSEKFTPTGFITQLEVLPNLSTLSAGYDARTPNRIALDRVRAAIQKYASNPITTFSVGTKTTTITDIGDLYTLQTKLESAVRAEENAERIGKGQRAKGRVIYGQFRRP